MNVLDLFSGIGGFSLGLERAGMRTVAFCEIDPYCQAVLRKRWFGIRCYPDIRQLTAARLARDGVHADIICGGFPCQDLSIAGKGAGLDGARSGLWSELSRLVSEVRPKFAIVENVPTLLGRGLGRVLGDLAEIGYDAEWHCIPASAIGAPHQRDRIWIVAYPSGSGYGLEIQSECKQGSEATPYSRGNGSSRPMAHADNGQRKQCGTTRRMGWGEIAAHDLASAEERTQWPAEPDLPRVAHGIPARLDRLRSLGNSIVPQIAEVIGKAVMQQVTSTCLTTGDNNG